MPDTKQEAMKIQQVIELRSMSSDQAIAGIVALLDEQPGLDAMDIANELRLDFCFVSTLCNQLLRDGRIALYDDKEEGDE